LNGGDVVGVRAADSKRAEALQQTYMERALSKEGRKETFIFETFFPLSPFNHRS
jgi:hypothetical protein